METPGSRFVDECKEAYTSERYADLLERFIAHLDLIYRKVTNEQGACCLQASRGI